VILWLDAQLPPSLAAWLASNYDVSAVGVRDLGLRDAEDREIFDQARTRGDVVIVSKDSDFVDLIERLGTPPSGGRMKRRACRTGALAANLRSPRMAVTPFGPRAGLVQADSHSVLVERRPRRESAL
jgi:predicted nuclease of predicted toxin-antitoxin system